jgi:hypothetical protein
VLMSFSVCDRVIATVPWYWKYLQTWRFTYICFERTGPTTLATCCGPLSRIPCHRCSQ